MKIPQQFGKFYALNERNVTLLGDDALATLRLVTSGFSGLLLLICACVFSNSEKFSVFTIWERAFLVIYYSLLVLNIIFLSLATLQVMISRELNRQIVEYDTSGVQRPQHLIEYLAVDLNALSSNCARGLLLSGISIGLLPALVGIFLFK